MTSLQQRAELHRQIWAIANDVRGSVDGWDFKQYVLGALFYRFISENFSSYMEAGDESIHYAALMTASLPMTSKTMPSGLKAISFTQASCSATLPLKRTPTTG